MSWTGVMVVIFILATMVVGIWTYAKIKGRAINYYVAGNRTPLFAIGIALCAQAFDANGSVGSAWLSYTHGFWAGAAIPIGLAACLFITGLFFAKPIHRMHLLTLPDFYRRRYNQSTETLAVLAMLASNIILVAGNLAGLGLLLDVVFGGGYLLMLITIAACILAYAVTGGLYATIRVSVLQVTVFILGMLLGFFWLIGDNGWTAMISQVPANLTDLSGLFDPGNGAYRNWSYLIALAFGDVVAIDFMQRVISSDSAETARRGCFMGGVLTLIVGIPVALVGLFGFYLEKLPSSYLLVDIAVQNMPVMVGGLLILGIIAASMSTAAGVILDLANIITRNLIQRYRKSRWNNHTMIVVSRLIAFPTMAAAVLFAYVRPEPGILLVLAFDVVLAGCFIPLALGIYWKRSNALGAIASIIVGSVVRIVLYYRIPDVYAGLDTLIPPAISLAVFILVSLATQRVSKPKHEALTYAPTDEELVKGTY